MGMGETVVCKGHAGTGVSGDGDVMRAALRTAVMLWVLLVGGSASASAGLCVRVSVTGRRGLAVKNLRAVRPYLAAA